MISKPEVLTECPIVGEQAEADIAFDRAALGTAAQLVGLADRMIEMTVSYATERKQFGVPIGSFQAVKHHLANARLAFEFARPLVYRAAWTIAEADAERAVAVSLAKAAASDARAPGRKGRAPMPRRDRLHDRIRPAFVHETGVGARSHVGRCRLAPGARPTCDPVSPFGVGET